MECNTFETYCNLSIRVSHHHVIADVVGAIKVVVDQQLTRHVEQLQRAAVELVHVQAVRNLDL